MNCNRSSEQMDDRENPFILHVECAALQNQNFRKEVWTGSHLQMTLMSIPPCGDIGMEMHEDTDQWIRIEHGNAVVKMGRCECRMEMQRQLNRGDAVFVPAGTWHNVINTGRNPLKISSVYAPPNHPRGTVHRTKEDAQRY